MTNEKLIEVAHIECSKLLKSEKGYNGVSSPEFWAEGYKKGLAEATTFEGMALRKAILSVKKENEELIARIEKMKPYCKCLCKNYSKFSAMGNDCVNGVCRNCNKWEFKNSL